MLSLISLADVAPERVPFRVATSFTGADLGCGSVSVARRQIRVVPPVLPVPSLDQGTGMPFARPRARKDAFLFGSDAQAASQVQLTRQQRISNVNYAHTTLTAATSGGSLGPHPARDPV
jgi:hypothetical protein